MKADREIILNAVSQNWFALRWAAGKLKGDREIVMRAVEHRWEALKWASDELKSDREVVSKALSQDWGAMNHILLSWWIPKDRLSQRQGLTPGLIH